MTDLITPQEAAARLGVHIATVRGWIRNKKIPAYRLGRFKRLSWSAVLASMEGSNGNPEKNNAKVHEGEGGSDAAS